ncbi:hypothetical protein BH11PLA2_BH11PLA2_10610 [soil metagenome]
MHEHGHTHDHGHSHDHANCNHDHGEQDHAHDHAHHDHGAENVEQLLTVGICGAFGAVATIVGVQALTTNSGLLKITLNPDFWPWVLGGGIALLFLSAVRGIMLFRSAGGECCQHDHGDPDHTHGSVFWKVVILVFPLLLWMMHLPNTGFSKERIDKMLGKDAMIDLNALKDVNEKAGVAMSFDDVANALRNPSQLEGLTGTKATLRGQLRLMNDREFTLYTLKTTCCASDTVPLKARIVLVKDDSGSSMSALAFQNTEWLQVTGVIQFVNVPNQKEPLPVIRAKLSDIKRTTPDL